jgi:hypothetical protein
MLSALGKELPMIRMIVTAIKITVQRSWVFLFLSRFDKIVYIIMTGVIMIMSCSFF